MKLKLLISSFCFLFILNFQNIELHASEFQDQFDISNRSIEICEAVENTFNGFQYKNVDTTDEWAFNGDRRMPYFSAYPEDKIVEYLIRTFPDPDETISILDIGGGMGINVQRLAETFAENYPERRFEFYTTFAEKSSDGLVNVIQGENYTLYRLARFNVENLSDALADAGLSRDIEFHWITSRFCFLHLVDSLGTFFEAYKHLKGLMTIDSFKIYTEKHNHMSYKYNNEDTLNFAEVLNNIGAEYMFFGGKNGKGYELPWIIKAGGTAPLKISYAELLIKEPRPYSDEKRKYKAQYKLPELYRNDYPRMTRRQISCSLSNFPGMMSMNKFIFYVTSNLSSEIFGEDQNLFIEYPLYQ